LSGDDKWEEGQEEGIEAFDFEDQGMLSPISPSATPIHFPPQLQGAGECMPIIQISSYNCSRELTKFEKEVERVRGQGQKRMSKYRLPPDLDISPPSLPPTSHDPSSSSSLPPIVPDFAGLG
jgi:hypothetical protein